ncbi:hypothetical protein CK501_03640 [Halovibrio salipaludis]|uniref:Uncharacterized protein n=1 Tax=Halovibrio salipaludis TaxID=2032626 RepID=A0A2A2FBB6_9GAMM|nr:hypothetical protein CK501_03640 [Halovibrio salipaludis]
MVYFDKILNKAGGSVPHPSANPGISVLTLVSLNRPDWQSLGNPELRFPDSLTINFILSIQT